jgi:hypothetical protein
VTRPRPLLTVALVAPLLVLLAACGSSDDAGSAPSTSRSSGGDGSTTTASSTPKVPGSVIKPDMDALRGVRYCEVLLLTKGAEGFSAEVWNTMGMSDCPKDQWDALDAKSIAAERGATAALLNGPRYWTLDSIDTDLRKGAAETTFGDIAMFRAATVDLGPDLPSQTPYTERPVARETVFGFDAGSEIYELVSADGATYVMQARSQTVDETLEEADFRTLGARLDLPDGWSYRVRTTEAPLAVRSTEGVAVVVQDELQNTYQRIDPT